MIVISQAVKQGAPINNNKRCGIKEVEAKMIEVHISSYSFKLWLAEICVCVESLQKHIWLSAWFQCGQGFMDFKIN